MADLAILGDDLTGTLDAAAPFARRGMTTVVALGPDALPEALASGAQVVGVCTDSREIAPEAAAAAVRRVLGLLPPAITLFKKIDSRLKGNIAAELAAIPHRRSLVAPAIPDFGRVTQGGRLGGFGLAETIDVAARLGAAAARATIPDVADSADLDRALTLPHDLAVGARGLAEALARARAPGVVPQGMIAARAACAVIGSTDPITGAQVDHLRRALPRLRDLPAPNGVLPQPAAGDGPVLLRAVPGETRAQGPEVAAALAEGLVRLALPPGSVLVLSGGACAQVILARLGVRVLQVQGEVLLGLPVSRGGGLTVITKSGGFGPPDTLTRLFLPDLSAGTR